MSSATPRVEAEVAPCGSETTVEDARRCVTDSLLGDLDDVARSVSDQVGKRLDALADWEDATWRDALQRSTKANVGAFLSTLAFGIPVATMEPPDGAFDLVDHLAIEPGALPTLIRIYQVGADATWEFFLARAISLIEDRDLLAGVVLAGSRHLSEYAEHVVERLSVGWHDRSLAAARAGGQRRAAVRRLLRGEPVDADTLRHPMDGWHLAIAVSSTEGPGFARSVRRHLSARHRDGHLLHGEDIDGVDIVWLSTERKIDPSTVAQECRDVAGATTIGVSGAAQGPTGIAVAGHEAKDTLSAVSDDTAGPVLFRDIAVHVRLMSDPCRAMRLAQVVLGPLADQGEEAARMRRTLRAYYACGGNKTAAGSLLHLHEKTVAYRLRAVSRAVGISIDEGRLNLEAALTMFAD